MRIIEELAVKWDGAPSILFLFATALLTRWPHWLITDTAGTNADLWRWVVPCGVSVGGIACKSKESPRGWLFMIRSVGTALTLFAASEVQPFSLKLHVTTVPGCFYLFVLPWLAIACGVAGWLRPSLFIVPIVTVSWYREEFTSVIGFPTTWGEELTLQESALFLLIGGLMLMAWKRRSPERASEIDAVFSSLIMGACAVHFGNYFYSAVAKVRLDGGPIDWATT